MLIADVGNRSAGVNWESLPDAVLGAIGERLDCASLQSAKLVSRSWRNNFHSTALPHQLALWPDAAAWHHRLESFLAAGNSMSTAWVYVGGRVPAEVQEQQIEMLSMLPRLQDLTLDMDLTPTSSRSTSAPPRPIIPSILSHLSTLTALTIHSSSPVREPTAAQLDTISSMTNLQSLALHLRHIPTVVGSGLPDQVVKLCGSLAALPQLAALSITVWPGFMPSQQHLTKFQAVADTFASLNKLQDLVLAGQVQLDRADLAYAVSKLSHLTHLKCNLLANSEGLLQTWQAEQYNRQQPGNEQLQQEDLKGLLSVVPRSRRHLQAGSPGNPLLSLSLSLADQVEVGDERIDEMADALADALCSMGPSLKELNFGVLPCLDWTAFSKADLALMVKLEAVKCWLRPPLALEGASLLAATRAAFSGLPALRLLDVTFNLPVARHLGQHLDSWAADLPQLTSLTLRLDSNGMTDELHQSDTSSMHLASLTQLQALKELRIAADCDGFLVVHVGWLPQWVTRLSLINITLHAPPTPVFPRVAAAAGQSASSSSSSSTQQGSTAAAPDWQGLQQLQELHLQRFRTDEHTLMHLLGSCPGLRTLRLRHLRWNGRQGSAASTSSSLRQGSTHEAYRQGDSWLQSCSQQLTSLQVWEAAGRKRYKTAPFPLPSNQRRHTEDLQLLVPRKLADLQRLQLLRRLDLAACGWRTDTSSSIYLRTLQQALAPLPRIQYLRCDNLVTAYHATQLEESLPLTEVLSS